MNIKSLSSPIKMQEAKVIESKEQAKEEIGVDIKKFIQKLKKDFKKKHKINPVITDPTHQFSSYSGSLNTSKISKPQFLSK